MTREDVISAADTALKSNILSSNAEIAFFGGSFTGIDRDYMNTLLGAAYDYVKNGLFKGIRISTRPDCIDQEVLDILKRYGVTSIELGAQSMDDEVLRANRRGHSADDVRNASRLIKGNGFSLGLQMMTGLYRSNNKRDLYTAQSIVLLNPDTVRIYPTIVLENTELARLYKSGVYKPQSLEQAVELCAGLLDVFEKENIRVIRLGLHDSPSLKRDYISGPYHPAFRELCESKRFLNYVLDFLQRSDCDGRSNTYTIEVSPSFVSKAIGQKRSNILRLKEQGLNVKIIGNKELVGKAVNIIQM